MKITVSDDLGPLTEMVLRNGVLVQPPTSVRTREVKVGDKVQAKATTTWEALDNEVKLGLKKANAVENIENPLWGAQAGAAAFDLDAKGALTFKAPGTARLVLTWNFVDANKKLQVAQIPGQFAVTTVTGVPAPVTALPIASTRNVEEKKPVVVEAKPWNWTAIGIGAALAVGTGFLAWKFWLSKPRGKR